MIGRRGMTKERENGRGNDARRVKGGAAEIRVAFFPHIPGFPRFPRCLEFVRQAAIALLAALLALPLACACSSADSPAPAELPDTLSVTTARRTVLVYMAAQNSLGLYGNQRTDSAEIMAGRQSLAAQDRLLLFMDDDAAPRLYRIGRDTSEPVLVKRWTQDENSASADFFGRLLSFVRQYYPSEEYGLVMWAHATGWLPPGAAQKGYTYV